MTRRDHDWPFNAFLFGLLVGPVAAALVFWSAWWLLLYVPVALIIGL